MNKKGFTLVELLVVVGIIVILSSIILSDYQTGRKQLSLQRSVHMLSQDLRRAEEMSMSATAYNCPTGYKMKGYGINLTAGQDFYWLKARCENTTTPGDYDDQTVGGKIDLEEGVQILSATSSYVFFYPPDPEVVFEDSDPMEVTLCLKADATQAGTVQINKAGLININE